jgi:hypothetical protein
MNQPLSPRIGQRGIPKGLTLIELLVVITIIVVLAALGTVGIKRIRSAARGATCTSNLRQMGAAISSYAGENNGRLPPLEDRTGSGDGLKGIWTQIIANGGYLPMTSSKSGLLGTNAGAWACPDCVTTSRYHSGYGAAEGTVMKVLRQSELDANSPKLSLSLAQIPNPERTWLVGDTANSAKDLTTSWYAIWANPKQWTGAHAPAARHAGKVNVCMVDGHVESLTMKDLLATDKDYTMFK